MQAPDPLIGRMISGRYRVQSLLGQSGMGTVYQAQQIPLGRAVALKMFGAAQVDALFHKRFFQEAAILAKLKSPNTVTVFDYGRDGDLYFMAMELVVGQPLDRILDEAGALPVTRALDIAQQVCRSLREAHAQGIVHRDLKPANIVLTQGEKDDEIVKVLDFGLAKRVNRASEDTQRDTVPGSPKYMAPEVIRQQPIDGRSDMYGLGVVLYQMLTGVVPFERDGAMDILVAHLQEPPPPMHDANPDVDIPPPVERIVMRCLAKLPDERFAGMQELLDALRGLAGEIGLGSDPTWGRPTTTPTDTTGSFATGVRAPRLGAADAAPPSAPTFLQQSSLRLFAAAGAVVLIGAIGTYVSVGNGDGSSDSRAQDAEASAKPPPAATAGTTAGPARVEAVLAAPHPAPVVAPAAGVAAAPIPIAPPALAALPPAAPGATPSATVVTEMPSVHVKVTSEPSGATVLLGGQRMGTTPASFEWRDPQARLGGQLVLVVKKSGYPTETVRRSIDRAEINVEVSLDPNAGDFDLRALQDRARAIEESEAAPPVIQIKPAEAPSEAPSEAEATAVEATEIQ